ncbi:DUF6288 domain-containing protein [uncultured Akkermansia sp.]|uniref:DUF6288 domain-containing protein n=1 Tax=uncultured Akkermansia sp. TaxID=512294 RepID=UPI00265CCA99|nr:DUF6288 domain-containing protein [uncultured Akkermansia sp.]
MENTPPLPSGFNINGYLVQSLKQTDSLCHVYYASDANHIQYLIREFCPQGLAVRDPESGKLRYPETTDIAAEVLPLKNDFEAQFRTGSLGEIPALGTLYLVYALPGVHPATEQSPVPASPAEPLQRDQKTLATPGTAAAPIPASHLPLPRKKKSSAGIWILILILLGGAYGAYHYTQKPAEAPPAPQEPAKPHPRKEKNQEASKPEKKAAQPAEEAADPFEQETAGVKEQPEETPEAVSPAEENGGHAVPAEEPAPEPEQPAEDSDTPETDASAEEQPEPAAPAMEKETPAPAAQAAAKPAAATQPRRKAVKQTTNMGDVNAYVKKYAKAMTLNQWRKQYANIYTSWFGNSEEVAKGWITTFGPLGFRARGLDSSWPDTNFRGFFPKSLLDPNGEPVTNLYMVTQVIEGSPSEKYVKEGDLILGIDGQPFKTALSLDVPYGPYQHQDRRGLDMHAGLLVDKAEGAGKITLNLIPAENVEKIQGIPPLWKQVFREERAKQPISLSIPVKGGQQLRLHVDDGGNGIGSDGFEWSDLRLEGPGGPIPLTKLKPIQYSVGYGAAKYDPERKVWLAHAVSSLVFDIPKGDWKLKGTGTPGGAASVGVTVYVGGASSLPDAVKKYVKNVTFKIPQLGSYAPGFPKNCAKSKAVVHMMSEWLAAQQREDGSWERPGGYCGNHYDTGWAGLALMATGNPKYDPVIKKAAQYIAFSGSQCWWAVPQASAGIFLCEYWLRYRDNSVLPAIRNGVQRMKNEVLYGDFVTGHGIHPGYAGTGVSIGGSHMCLFLALASKTPARTEDDVLDKMMDHAQSICPTGMGPYGRMTETFTFEPNRQCGGTYSGRHGPYYIASLICGGPELYTKNSRIMYKEGPIGGCDQGHSSETLSMMWALPAYWRTDPEVYYKNMEAFRWKLTLQRPFDGGMVQNPNRLELMTADPVIGTYIRTSIWITALCAERQNLAITGKPEFQAKTFRKVPPIIDTESRFLNTYVRNWSMVNAALGAKAPGSLKSAIRELKNIPVEQGCRFKLISLVNSRALPIAKAIMAIPGLDQLTKATCAEMILGMDVRIFFEPKRKDDKVQPGEYSLNVDVQQPLGGRALGLQRDKELEGKANSAYKYDFAGTVQFSDTTTFSPMETISWTPSSNFGGQWNVHSYKKDLSGPTQPGVQKMSAKVKWRVNDLDVEYDRPIAVGGFEVGCGEKARPVTNCNHLWVPGILIRDHGNWGCSFHLPDGTYISAASQGNQIEVYDETDKKKEKTWVSPNDACLTQGSRCLFRVSTDWHGLECRVRELKLLGSATEEVTDYKLKASPGGHVDTEKLLDRDATTAEELEAPSGEDDPLVLELSLKNAAPLRAVDIKLEKGNTRLIIEANKGGKWIPIHWGSLGPATAGVSDAQKAMYANEPEVLRMLQLPGNGFIKCMRTFEPITTNKLRVKLFQKGGKVRLAELHVYKADAAKPAAPKRLATAH